MKRITKEWLKKQNPCNEGYRWFIHQRARDEVKVIERLIKEKRYDWANWLIVRRMTRQQYIQYAVFAAEQVIDIYEASYPDDKRPRAAIEAARRYITDDSDAAVWAADAARAAWAAVRAAVDATASTAAWAAASAANAADAARTTKAVEAAVEAAAEAAAAEATEAARDEMQQKILSYGIRLLNKHEVL